MTKIGLVSDTHGHWDADIEEFFAPCQQLWHAGDIGNLELADTIARFRPLVAVYGNIDGATRDCQHSTRTETQHFYRWP